MLVYSSSYSVTAFNIRSVLRTASCFKTTYKYLSRQIYCDTFSLFKYMLGVLLNIIICNCQSSGALNHECIGANIYSGIYSFVRFDMYVYFICAIAEICSVCFYSYVCTRVGGTSLCGCTGVTTDRFKTLGSTCDLCATQVYHISIYNRVLD